MDISTNTLLIVDIVTTVLTFVCVALWIRGSVWDSNQELARTMSHEMALGLEAKGEEEAGKLNFDKVIGVFVEMSDTAKATFLYRLVAVMDEDHLVTLDRYIQMKRKKKTDKKNT